MKKYTLLLWGVLLILLNNCTKQINVDFPKEEQKLVLNALISPSYHFIHCSSTTSIFDNEIYPITDAEIKITSSFGEFWDLHHVNDGFYDTNFYKIPGLSYTIEVKSKIGNFLAVDTIPTLIPPVYARYSNSNSVDINGDELMDLTVALVDKPEKNYFEFLLMDLNYDSLENITEVNYYLDVVSAGNIITSEGDLDFDPLTLVFSDNLLLQDTNFITIQYERNPTPSKSIQTGKIPGYEEPGLYLKYRSCSYTYYQLQKEWIRHRYNQTTSEQISSLSGAAITSEPTPTFSNNLLEDGLGVFAAYNEGYMWVECKP